MANTPRTVRSSTAFETPWFKLLSKTVVGMPGAGGEAEFFALRPDDYVSVLALTQEGRVLLVRQYRPVVEAFTLELPSGHVDPGESPAEAARRELAEETGYEARGVELFGNLIPDTGRLANRLWCYFASGVAPCCRQGPLEPGIEVVTCTQAELFQHVAAARFDHALHLAILLLAVQQNKLSLPAGGWGAAHRPSAE